MKLMHIENSFQVFHLLSKLRMPRNSKYQSPAKLTCPFESCGRKCRSHSGLTRHLQSKHKGYYLSQLPAGTPSTGDGAGDYMDVDLSSVDEDEETSSSDNDSDMSARQASGDAFDFDNDQAGPASDFEMHPAPSTRSNSPSRHSESDSETSESTIKYHPLINGQ
jgi:hypothetical protein